MSNQDVTIFTKETSPVLVKRKTKLSEILQAQKGSKSGIRQIKPVESDHTFEKRINGDVVGTPVSDELEVIIVDMLPEISREYHDTQYKKGQESIPVCFSAKGDVPESDCEKPQAKSCAVCPQNVKEGDKSKPCKFRRRIAVLVAGDMSGNPYVLELPATSLFGEASPNTYSFERYVKFLAHNELSPDHVVTVVSFNKAADFVQLNFAPARSITDDEYELVQKVQEDPKLENLTRITVRAVDSEPAPTAVAKPKPVEEPEEDEEPEVIPEPKKRQKKEEPVADDLSDIISEWGQDE